MNPGDRLGRYLLREEIGSGASGTVFLAEEVDEAGPGRTVALKVFHPHLARHAGFVARFEREAASGRRVAHENVVRILDVDLAWADGEPRFFLVMEHVPGRSLRRVLADVGPLPEPLLREIARQSAAALAALHGAGLVHRDVKPENIVLSDDGRLRLTDLGVTRVLDASTALTEEGRFLGTVLYAAPERLSGSPAGPPSDLYALGVSLHELAVGRNAFLRDDAVAVARAHAETVPLRVRGARPEVSPFLDALIAALLEKDPAKRPDAAALEAIVREGEASSWWLARAASASADADERRGARPLVRRETSLIGRDDDLRFLREAWERARAGAGGALWLEGEAGIGKSRLLGDFLEGVGRDARVLYGSYPPSGIESGLARGLASLLGTSSPVREAAELLGDLAAFAPLLAAECAHLPPPPEAPAWSAASRASCYARIVESAAAVRPLVWVVEDLHFAPAEERSLARTVAAAANGRRALVVGTSRAGYAAEASAWAKIEGAQARPLARLSPREVILVLRELLGSETLAERLGGRIAFASDGVPFYLFEIVRGLRDGQFLSVTAEGHWLQTKDIEHVRAPASVRELLLGRLGDLSTEERGILDAAAVVGFEFDPALVAAVLGRRLVHVLQVLAAVERRTSLVRSLARTIRFDHHLVQEVLYEDLPTPLREETHALVAEAMEERAATAGGIDEAEVTGHYLAGSRPKGAARHLEAALDRLEAAFRHADVAATVERALGVSGLLDPSTELRVLERARVALSILGRSGEQLALAVRLRERAEATGTREAVARARVVEAIALTDAGRDVEGLSTVRRAIGELEAAGAGPEDLLDAWARESWSLVSLNRYDEALALLEPRVASLAPGPATVSRVRAFTVLGTSAWGALRYDTAVRRLREARDMAGALGLAPQGAAACGSLAMVFTDLGRYDDADAQIDALEETARTKGLKSFELIAWERRGGTLLARGRLAEAIDRLSETNALARGVGHPTVRVNALHALAKAEFFLGRREEARACAEALADLYADRGWERSRPRLAFLQAALRAEDGDVAGARAALAAVRDHSALSAAALFRSEAEFRIALLDRRAGAALDAGALRGLVERARGCGLPGLVCRALAALVTADPSEAPGARRELDELASRTAAIESWEAWDLVAGASGDPTDAANSRKAAERLLEGAPPEHRERLAERLASPPPIQPL